MPEKPESIWILLSSQNVFTTPCVEPSNGFRDVFPSRLNLSLLQCTGNREELGVHQESLGLCSCRTRIKGPAVPCSESRFQLISVTNRAELPCQGIASTWRAILYIFPLVPSWKCNKCQGGKTNLHLNFNREEFYKQFQGPSPAEQGSFFKLWEHQNKAESEHINTSSNSNKLHSLQSVEMFMKPDRSCDSGIPEACSASADVRSFVPWKPGTGSHA